ncbi:MAG: hypothetical protein IKF17_05160 [Clostridia bacterium]|nr:hypothetical protein [Clostridia bacterium]
MPDDDRNCGFVDNISDERCGCGGSDNTILFFLIIFLLLFTNFGARG